MASPSVDAHEGLPFANPLADADVATAIGALNLPDGAVVVETGCGSAEMLARVLEAYPSARGVGVDLDADWLARARRNLDARLPGRDVTLVHASAEEAGLEPGGYDAVVNVASSHAHGGYPAALGALAALARPSGVMLLGEGFWLREPSEEFLEALGGATRDELGTLDELREHAGRAGLEPELVATASEDDWARYEEGLAANAQRRGDEESLAYARRIVERRALPHGTTTLGFALLVLRRTA